MAPVFISRPESFGIAIFFAMQVFSPPLFAERLPASIFSDTC
jgi:hypothetical protein